MFWHGSAHGSYSIPMFHVQVGFSLILNPITRIINLSRAFCDPGPRSNQIMSAAQHLALKNTIQIRARIMEIGANYKMADPIIFCRPYYFFNMNDLPTLFSPGGCGLLIQCAKVASVVTLIIEPNCLNPSIGNTHL